MKQALLLCGGKAQRLRPYSYGLPKACMPFLNLPLLSLSWFYLEKLKVSHFLLNAHLFPEKLKQTVDFLSQAEQKSEIFFEKESLGAAGTLYKLKKLLQKQKEFFYLNGDSLFFPSHEDQLSLFEEDFVKTQVDASFFSVPMPSKNMESGALWCDKDLNLKFVGEKQDLAKDLDLKNLSPFQFSGLALFKSSLLDNLNSNDFHLFADFINPLLSKKKFKIFLDKEAKILEAGDSKSYIESSKFCLDVLFENQKNKGLKNILEQYFSRFDPEDQIVGLKNGKIWSQKTGFPLLAPSSVKGLKQLELKGFAILGPQVQFFGKSQLKDSVLGSQVSWKGTLDKDIVLKFSASSSSL